MVRAAALNPLHPDFRNDLAMAILNSGPLTPQGYARAATELLAARRLKPIDYRFPLHLARLEARFAARLFDDTKARERAAALYREAVRLAPLDPRPRLELAGHLIDMRLPGEALREAQQALVLEPSFVRARVLEASILLDMGRRSEARISLQKAEATLLALAAYVPDSSYARTSSWMRGSRESGWRLFWVAADPRRNPPEGSAARPSNCGQALGRGLY